MITRIPFMGMTLKESRVVLHCGLDRKHTFVQLTDIHLCCADDTETDEVKKLAADRAAFWAIQGGFFRDGKHLDPNEASKIVAARVREIAPEKVIFTGDTVDFASASNFRAVADFMNSLGAPVIVVPGNHDAFGDDASEETKREFAAAVGEKVPFKVVELAPGLDGLVIDDCRVKVTDEQIEQTRDAISAARRDGKKLFVLMHAPILTASARWPVRSMWGYTWMVGEEPQGENGVEFVRLLNENTDVVAAVFAGHVHRESGDGEGARFGEQYDPSEVRQFTAAPAFTGYYRIIEID